MNKQELIKQAEKNIAQAAVHAQMILDNSATPDDFKIYAINMIELGEQVQDKSLAKYLENDEMIEKKSNGTYKHVDFSKSLRDLIEGKESDIDVDLLSEMTVMSQRQVEAVNTFILSH